MRRFVLDWDAVKWLYAGPEDAQVATYLRDGDFSPLVAERYHYQTFEFRHPGTMLSARTTSRRVTPVILDGGAGIFARRWLRSN